MSSSLAEATPGSAPNLCHTCTEPISAAQFIRVGQYKFHKDHFLCCECQTSLHEKKFHHKDGKFFCQDDFVNKFCHQCRHCNTKIVTGSVIQAFGGYYHPHCFVCHSCEKAFVNGKYYEHDEHPRCDKCYFDLTADKCAVCNLPVGEADKVLVQKKPFHSSCLSCSHCSLALAKNGSIFQKDGQVYCRNDYLDLFCKRCTACADHILKHCVSVNDEYYHPDCLKCSHCSKTLDKYICISGHLRCNDHTNISVGTLTCSQCDKVVDGEVVLSVGRKMHPHCFKCHFCNAQLQKESAKLKDDKLCCHDCRMKKDPSLQARNAKDVGSNVADSSAVDVELPSSARPVAAAASVPEVKTIDPDKFTKYEKPSRTRKPSKALPQGKIEWKKGELIGKGSFGKVYMAMNSATGELIAVKQVRLNCFPAADHEVLTQQGFLGLDQVLAHFDQHEHLAVACYVDGRLEYHNLPLSAVTHTKAEMQQLVAMNGREGGAAEDISLHPTDNHRMWVRMGSSAAGASTEAVPASWQIHPASAVLDAGARDASATVQFTSRFESGVHWAVSSLPFLSDLGLDAADEIDAAVELYGCWLASGRLDHVRQTVDITATTPAQQEHLDSLLARLQRVLPVLPSATGAHIASSAWVAHFASSITASAATAVAPWALKALDARRARLLLDSMCIASGEQPVDPSSGVSSVRASTSTLRDDLVQLALHAGFTATFAAASKEDTPTSAWRVEFTESSRESLPTLSVAKECSSMTTHDRVWCVSVPTQGQLIMFRRVLSRALDGTVSSASRPLVVGNTAEEQEQAAAIQNEIGLMENLRHPNIVSLLGTQRNGNKLSILMEYVPGKSLDSLLEKFGGFSEKVIRSYTKQLLEALAYCHANRVVHRDIKGKNILIDTKGNLKLADFGSAKRFANVMSKDAPSLSYNYTPLWTAPEVLVGDYNSKVDIWSLGCVIIEMASAKPPWSEQNFENPFRALYHIGNSDAIPRIPDSLSPTGLAFVKLCLQRNPDQRCTALELLQQEWLNGIEGLPNNSDDSGSDDEDEGSESD